MICNDLRETALPELRKKYPGKSDDEAIEMEYDRLIKIQEAYLEDMR